MKLSKIIAALLTFVPLIASTNSVDQENIRDINRDANSLQEKTNQEILDSFKENYVRLSFTPPQTLNLKERTSQVVKCQAEGRPAPVVYWYKDGQRIEQARKEVRGRSDVWWDITKVNARLYLDCVSQIDDGEYTCVAENPYDSQSATMQLSVSPDEIPNNEICSKEINRQYPRIISWNRSVLTNIGQYILLPCIVDGMPKPTISWYGRTNGILWPVKASRKYRLLLNSFLYIRKFQASDEGEYMCVAENEHGSANSVTRIALS